MTDTRGTFRLKNVRQDILNNEYISMSSVWLQENDVGHFRDQTDSDGPLSRTNLDTELTAYAPGITNITRWSAGSSCYTHGLFAGGAATGSTSAPAISSTYKLTYSSYTSARAPSANLPIPKAISIGVASEDNAYINSGYEGGGSPAGQTGTCKISFATDTATNLPSANIAAINWEMQSLTDGAGGGYLFGGTWVPGQANTGSRCYKITYATDGLAQLPGSNTTWNTSETNRNPETSRASMMNRTAGYQSGGNSFPGSDGSSMTTKLTYSSMAWSVVPGAYLPNPRRKAASGTGSRGKAWYGCGQQSGNHSNFTLLDFSAETWSAVPGMNHPGPSSSGQESANTSTSPRDSLKGADKAFDLGYDSGKSKRWFDGSPTNMKGYFTGGTNQSGQPISITQKLDYSSETVSTIPANMPTTYHYPKMGATGNASKGILAGGEKSGVTKFTYSAETYAYLGNIPGSLDYRWQQGHTSTTAAYFSGGYSSYIGSHTYKMPYSSDVTAQVPGASLNEKRDFLNGTGMSKHDSHGYVIGGVDPAGWPSGSPSDGYTNSEKITYASDTFAILPGMMTTSGSKYSTAAVGIPGLNGYWVQGVPSTQIAKSDCGKVNFSTDSMASLPNLDYQMLGKVQSAVGAGDRVYFAGGWRWQGSAGGTAVVSSFITKVVCSTDTFSVLPGGLNTALDKMASLTQTENGFPIKSPDLASDGTSTAPTPTASTYEALNPSLNANAVFAAGRGPSSPSPSNNRSKLTFSNDSMASMPSFTTNYNGYGNASSTTRGYLTGGWGTNSMGDTQNKRWYNQYSNDTSGQLPGSIPYNAGGFFSVNSETKLYAGGGGWSSGQYSSVHKMAFANETNVGVPGMQLAMPLKNAAGVGDKTVGYACGSNYYNNWRSYISKITYATETMATSPATLAITGSSPYYGATGTSSKTKGYIMAGNATDKLTFSTDTISTLGGHSSGLSSAWPGTSANSATAGYTMLASPSPHMIKFTFSTEGASTVTSVFSPARSKGGGMSQAMFGGAYSPAPYLI